MFSSAAVPGHLRLGLCQVPTQLDALHRAHERRTQVAGAWGQGGEANSHCHAVQMCCVQRQAELSTAQATAR